MRTVQLTATFVTLYLVTITHAAYAESADYNFETSLVYYNYKYDGAIYDYKDKSVGINYYFDTIKPGTHPYAEATFFSRSQFVAARLGTNESKSGNFTIDRQSQEIAYGYASNSSPLTLYAGYLNSDLDIDRLGVVGNGDTKQYEFSAGYFITTNLLATLEYMKAESSYNHVSIANKTADQKSSSATIKYIHDMDAGAALSLLASYRKYTFGTDITSNTDIKSSTLFATYYPTQQLGLGGYYISDSAESASNAGDTMGVLVSYFITRKFFIEASYAKFDNDTDSANDYDYKYISANLRF